jgi:DUF1365 family protein
MTGSALYRGEVVHQRLRPRKHRLRYRIFSLLLDLDQLPALGLRLFAHNRFNLFALHDRDYLDGSGAPLAPAVRRLVGEALGEAIGRVRLLTMPRILGFAFNPVSLYFCDGADDGARLRAILYEVNNTFGQRHSYLIPVETADAIVRQSCDKAFHVSPFMAMAMRYRFTILPPAERLGVTIAGSDARGTLIVASHQAIRHPLTDRELARAFVAYPLLTVKVVVGILWEALRLWIKRVPVHACPVAPHQPISVVAPMAAADVALEEPACI